MIERMLFRFRHFVTEPAISKVMNTLYWTMNLHKGLHVFSLLDNIELKTEKDVRNFMRKFQWSREKLDWTPWVGTIFATNFEDDCDGAAIMGRWALGKIGIKSRIIHLWEKGGDKRGHDVCISKDNRIMISNDEFVELGDDWIESVKAHFDGMFDMVQDGWKFL